MLTSFLQCTLVISIQLLFHIHNQSLSLSLSRFCTFKDTSQRQDGRRLIRLFISILPDGYHFKLNILLVLHGKEHKMQNNPHTFLILHHPSIQPIICNGFKFIFYIREYSRFSIKPLIFA